MKNQSVFSIILGLLLLGCSSTKVEKGFHSDSRPKYSIAVDKQGRKEGPEVWWYANGGKKYEATNRVGFREGKFTAWHPDGKKWYEGFEYRGKPESTLTYWHPNGKLKSQALYRDGIQLERTDFDQDGNPLALKTPAAAAVPPPGAEADSISAADGLRRTSLQMWAMRVRQTVESFWVLPRQFEKERPYRAVAKIKVGREGKILGVTWVEKSPSQSFNRLAQSTFKRIRRLPAFPPGIADETLEIQYEFISLGKRSPRRKLEARESTGE